MREIYTETLINIKFALSDREYERYLRSDNLASESLHQYQKDLEKIINRLELITQNFKDISINDLKDLQDFYSRFHAFLSLLASLSNVEFVNKRQENIQQFESYIEELRSLWSKIAAVISNNTYQDSISEKASELEKKLKRIEEERVKLESKLNETENLKASLENQISEFRDRYSELNANLELDLQENIFKSIARKHKTNAMLWLAGILVAGFLLVKLIFHLKDNFCFEPNCFDVTKLVTYNNVCWDCGEKVLWLEILKSVLFRILIISLNIYLLTFCVRNYNAHMHNKTINELRQNSFSAALHFYNTTTGEKKDEILLKAADAIFSHRATGYNGKDNNTSPSFMQNIFDKISTK